jgi:hypothetical protein
MANPASSTGGTAASNLPAAGGTSESTISSWAGPYVTNMLGRAQGIANEPYQTYQGPMTAGESGLQSKVFQGLGGLAFPGNLGTSFSAAGAPTIGAGGIPAGDTSSMASQYMNPYLQSVLNPQLAEMRRQNEITNMGANAKFTGAGAFGGGRNAIMNAENARNMMQEQNKAIGQGYASAYDRAMGQFNTEQGQSKDLVNMLANAGQAQRGIEQEGITADYNEFLTQREDPMKKLQFQQSMLQGMPYQTVTNAPASKSGIGQLVEAFGGMTQLEDALKKFNLTGG